MVVAVIKELSEREDAVEIATHSISTGGEVGALRGGEILETGRDGSGFDLPFLCGVSDGKGEKCIALGASLTTLLVAFKTDEPATEVVDSTVITELINGVLLLERVDEGMLFEEVRVIAKSSGFGGDGRMTSECVTATGGTVFCVVGEYNGNGEARCN